VAAVKTVSKNFRLIDLQGETLQGVEWASGQRLQIKVGSPLVARTFTPILFDAELGLTRILGYAHGAGPGSAWLRRIAPGDVCQMFGPRGSLDVASITGPTVLFGDETSFGLAAAMSGHGLPREDFRCFFEVTEIEEATLALQALEITPTALVKRDDETRVAATIEQLLATSSDATQFVLTGRAQFIQVVKKMLKQRGVSSSRVRAKAYWSPGKTGLD
jgi:NADPH-dependent ferric siderophore reductase